MPETTLVVVEVDGEHGRVKGSVSEHKECTVSNQCLCW